jgi:predicted ATPase/DNA-binding CsgD family transcriptional regulator
MASLKPQAGYEGLSERAVEILGLLAEGLSDREIAERLVMTINTVKWYNRQIYSILGVGSRTQAIARARDLHLLESDARTEPPAGRATPAPAKYNLPAETTRFIGRSAEIDHIKRLLQTTRLLTLTGSPGTGKTRLALRVAAEVRAEFADGVYFVPLAPLHDAALVANALAAVLGIPENVSQPLNETLKHHLRHRHLLLVLDNFEHVLPGAGVVSELLAATEVKILVTSREVLHLYGEQEYFVPPLVLPDPSSSASLSDLAQCEAVSLFVQQARAVKPEFELKETNALDIAQICVRLDGLPLAIELAASRTKLLNPQTLLARLVSPLDALTGGAHDLPARQQTLRNTIEWSYNLLGEGEKMLFARLAVFRGGRSLEAIETVCGRNLPMDVFDGLASLVDKSLVQQKETPTNEPRFVMLETLQEYAGERLEASGEAGALRQRHAVYFVELAERAQPELRQAGFSYWMARLETEYDNLHTVLEWSLGDGDLELGLRLLTALRDFLIMSGRFIQAEHWTQSALAQTSTLPPGLRVGALTTAGIVLYYSSQQRALQKQLLDEAVALAREVDDKLNLAWALIFLGVACVGQAAEYEEALSSAEEGLALFRTLGYKPGMAHALNIIGELTRIHGDDAHAQAVYEECLRLVRETGEVRREAMCLNNLGCVMMHRGAVQQAEQFFRSALIKRLEVGHDKRGMLTNILFLAGALAATGDPARAARLLGAAKALLEPLGVGLEPGDQPEHDRDLALVRAQLDPSTFDGYWNEGRTFSLEQTIAFALERTDQ